MKHTFILSDESLNTYGYRILTEGIDTNQYERNPVVLYMHQRGERGDEVIGRALNLRKEDSKLIGDIEFDEDDELAKKISGKVERGYLRMASVHADVTEVSEEPEHILPGQRYETVTKCTLVELSIVDIGGNNNAIRLSRDGQPVKLNALTKTNNPMKIEHIALALSLGANADEQQITAAITGLQTNVATLTKDKEALEAKLAKLHTDEAIAFVDKAVKLSLIHEGLKDTFLKAFEDDFEGQKAKLSKMIADAEADGAATEGQEAVKKVVLGAKGKKSPAGNAELSYDYLQKNDPEELRRLRDDEPDKYAQLAKEYGEGKKHVAV